MTINCKAAVIRSNSAKKPYAESLPLSVEEISIESMLFLGYTWTHSLHNMDH